MGEVVGHGRVSALLDAEDLVSEVVVVRVGPGAGVPPHEARLAVAAGMRGIVPVVGAGDYSQVSESGDRVFLITAGDLLAYCGGAAAQFRKGSDYAACRGLRMMHEDNRFFGGGYWFLRTPRADVANASNKLRCEITASCFKDSCIRHSGNHR